MLWFNPDDRTNAEERKRECASFSWQVLCMVSLHMNMLFLIWDGWATRQAEKVQTRLGNIHPRAQSRVSLGKEMATHSSILAWKISLTEEPGRLQSIESQRVRHDWAHMWHGPRFCQLGLAFGITVPLWLNSQCSLTFSNTIETCAPSSAFLFTHSARASFQTPFTLGFSC